MYKIAQFLFHFGVGKGVAKGLRKLKGRFRPKLNFAYVEALEGDRESRIYINAIYLIKYNTNYGQYNTICILFDLQIHIEF